MSLGFQPLPVKDRRPNRLGRGPAINPEEPPSALRNCAPFIVTSCDECVFGPWPRCLTLPRSPGAQRPGAPRAGSPSLELRSRLCAINWLCRAGSRRSAFSGVYPGNSEQRAGKVSGRNSHLVDLPKLQSLEMSAPLAAVKALPDLTASG